MSIRYAWREFYLVRKRQMCGIYCLCRAHYSVILYELNISIRSMRTVYKSTFHVTGAIFSDKPIIKICTYVQNLNLCNKNQHIEWFWVGYIFLIRRQLDLSLCFFKTDHFEVFFLSSHLRVNCINMVLYNNCRKLIKELCEIYKMYHVFKNNPDYTEISTI